MQGLLGFGVLKQSSPSLGVAKGSGFTPNPLLTNLVAQWKMNGVANSNEVDTVSGYVLSDNGTVGSAAGVINNARILSAGNWLAKADGTPFNLYPMTITCWLKYTSAAAGFFVWHFDNASSGYGLYVSSGRVNVWYYKDNANKIVGMRNTVFNDGNWHHVGVVIDASGGTVYVDGVLDGTVAWTGTPAVTTYTGYFAAGVSNLDQSNFDGNIDCLKVWSSALAPSLISQDYNGGAGIEL